MKESQTDEEYVVTGARLLKFTTILGLPITVAGEAAGFMRVLDRSLMTSEFCRHGCCVVPTSPVSAD